MTAVNEITGNRLVSRSSNQEAYAANFDGIFRKKSAPKLVTCCGGCGSGICETKIIDFEYYREEDEEGNLIESRTIQQLVSKCCGGDVFYWDVEKDEEVIV